MGIILGGAVSCFQIKFVNNDPYTVGKKFVAQAITSAQLKFLNSDYIYTLWDISASL